MIVQSVKMLRPALIKCKTDVAKSPTAADVVAKSQGMNAFLNKTYMYTGGSLFSAIGFSHLAISASISPFACLGGGLITAIGGIIGMNRIQPINDDYHYQGYKIYRTKNPASRLMCYWAAIGGIGLSAAPLFQMANLMDPMLLPQALALTGAVFGGVSMVAYKMPPGKMLSYGRVLGGGVLGLLGVVVSGLLAQAVIGPNLFSALAFKANTYLGLGLFSALIAYDTHLGMRMYQQGNADHLSISMSLFLDLWNVLVRILQILMRMKE